jgi:hypothetical protein
MAKEKKVPAQDGSEETPVKVKRARRTPDQRYDALRKAISKLPLDVQLRLAEEIKADSQAHIEAELAALEAKREQLLAAKTA